VGPRRCRRPSRSCRPVTRFDLLTLGPDIDPPVVSSRWRAEATRPPVREVEPVVAEIQGAQFVSLEDADAEARGEKKPGGEPEARDEVEPDDESLDDAAFIEESEEEDTDVTEIIGGDIENEEGT
jgi:hypothetical protein